MTALCARSIACADVEIWIGDAVTTLRQQVRDRSVDLVYMDPPFNTDLDWTGKNGGFSDKWRWNGEAAATERELGEPGRLIGLLAPTPSARAYLVTMARAFTEIRRVLRLTGSFLLHCDDTMRAYLRTAIDVVFGPTMTIGEIVWKRTTAHNSGNRWGRVHDTIVAILRSKPAGLFRAWSFEPLEFRQADGIYVTGFIDDVLLNSGSRERSGYPTQKPVALLERLIDSFSLPGDLVLDPMCGSGTTLVAAARLNRRAVGIDANPDAVALARARFTQPIQRNLL